MIADLVTADAFETGSHKEGVFFAARTFIMKVAMSISLLVLPSVLVLGKSVSNNTGVRITGFIAAIFCMIGLIALFKYDETEILKILKENEGE